MLMILSPAKRQRFSDEIILNSEGMKLLSRPEWIGKSKKLVDLLKAYSPDQLAGILKVSDAIAVKDAGYYEAWRLNADLPVAQPAVLAYDGDAYRALNAKSMSDKEWLYLNAHLRILSGLYGVLKPFDLIQPYRLEIGSAVVKPDGVSLYQFWAEAVMKTINPVLDDMDERVLINLASNEYIRTIDRRLLNVRMITPVFREMRQGIPIVLGLYAKQARGMMVRYAADNAITDAEDLKAFDLDDYVFNGSASTQNIWVFQR